MRPAPLAARAASRTTTAFLLAIDQFEELFTFADPDERRRFDRLLAAALEDPDCPLFVISTVRADFLDRFGEDLPRLVAVRNRLGRPWTLAPIGSRRPARGDRRPRPARRPRRQRGARRRWSPRRATSRGRCRWSRTRCTGCGNSAPGNRLSGRLFTDQGGLAGILSRSADDLLSDRPRRSSDPGAGASVPAGPGGPGGHAACPPEHIARRSGGCRRRRRVWPGPGQPPRRPAPPGRRQGEGPLRLITVTERRPLGQPDPRDADPQQGPGRCRQAAALLADAVGLHRTAQGAGGVARAARRRHPTWLEKEKAPSYQWSHERVREAVAALRQVGPEVVLSADEREFLGPIDPDAMLAELEAAGDDAQTPSADRRAARRPGRSPAGRGRRCGRDAQDRLVAGARRQRDGLDPVRPG